MYRGQIEEPRSIDEGERKTQSMTKHVLKALFSWRQQGNNSDRPAFWPAQLAILEVELQAYNLFLVQFLAKRLISSITLLLSEHIR